MCSNFGFHHQPGRTPCKPESQRHGLRAILCLSPLQVPHPAHEAEPSDDRPEALNLPRIRSN